MPDFGDSVDQNGTGTGRYQYQGQRDPNDVALSPDEWERYQQKRHRQALLGVLGLLGMTTGLGAAGAAFTGAGGAAAGAAGSGALPAIEGGAPWAITPYAGTASMVPTGAALTGGTIGAGAGGAGTGAAGAGGAATGAGAAGVGTKGLLGGLSARDLLAIATGTAGTVGSYINGRNNRTNLDPNTSTKDPQLQELLSMMMSRMKKAEPLQDSVYAMANGLLPTQYQNGGRGGQSNG